MLRLSFLYGSLFLLVPLVGCGSSVTTPGDGGSANTTSNTSSGTTNTTGCAGSAPYCWVSCDSLMASTCTGGEWVCPAGSSESPPGGCNECDGPSGVCDVCNPPGFSCNADAACLGSCPAIACLHCPLVNQPFPAPPGCACNCDSEGRLACAQQPSCCTSDMECGDIVPSPCVNGVCKTSPGGGQCWSNGDCASGSCVGAIVCPCGAACDEADQPGFCEGPPPP